MTFSAEYAKSVTKREFIAHFEPVYPFNTIDLGAKYDELTGRTDEKVEKKLVEKPQKDEK